MADYGWLKSRHSFSFADYHNRDRMGFGALRVINDDVIEPSSGFGMHLHSDMEIVTIVMRGAVRHEDSEGNLGVTRAGEIQYMSAGTGITHSEYNASDSEPLELFQIWIHPNQRGLPPAYAQRDVSRFDSRNRWALLVSPDGRSDSMAIRQDAWIYTATLEPGMILGLPLLEGSRGQLLMVVEGEVRVGGEVLFDRDEMQLADEERATVQAHTASRLLLFDVPMAR
jgi:redox-sensitive bicupin YhaK (pirin superfamily)